MRPYSVNPWRGYRLVTRRLNHDPSAEFERKSKLSLINDESSARRAHAARNSADEHARHLCLIVLNLLLR